MAGMWFDPKIPPLLDEILAAYAENSGKIDGVWVVNKNLLSQKYYDSLTQTGKPVELLEAFLKFLNDDTEDNEKILNGLFKEMNQKSDMHSAQSGGFIADEQPSEDVAVRNKTIFKSANKK